MPKLFLCYYSGNRAEVDVLAQELRQRGIGVWLDHDQGFSAGDNTQTEARRVIGDPDEIFGLLVYATPTVFDRSFILQVELQEALRRKQKDQGFVLMAVPRHMGFAQLTDLCVSRLGEDISVFHSHAIRETDEEGIHKLPLRPQFMDVARLILRKRLQMSDAPNVGEDRLVGINFCTRDHLPPSVDDLLDIDATHLFTEAQASEDAWRKVVDSLRDIKHILRETVGITAVRVRGSKHLTAAFLIGWMFPPPTIRELQVQQQNEIWSSRCVSQEGPPLREQIRDGSVGSSRLFVELTTTEKSVHEGVSRYIKSSRMSPFTSLLLEPINGLQRGAVRGNATACAMAIQIRSAVARLVEERGISEIHLFAAVPQGLMSFIGHNLNATVPVQLYEYDGYEYQTSIRITGDMH